MLGLVALQLTLPVADDLPPVAPQAVRRPVLVNPPQSADFPGILERPLFDPDRRPDAGAAPADDMARYTLLGIGTAAGAATALLVTPEGTALRILPGQAVGDWEVTAIEPGRVVLSRGDERLELRLGNAPPAAPGESEKVVP
ncbi:hypothetical protein D3874_13705 [Oleomonas cavernae]|uniref:Type II secretion system protein GspC N-terminal domain-containing protein n=1 Tax=Oleomonas cavernae TaxID=2320859 RepID=A0A418WD38_9PROT|nr:hypothetical protein [Oleomonas cavernae]RJF87945.1 hypothetical protein D3874_13705 [Oleomonas cavernae]